MIIVTGGAGFIGSHLVKGLNAAGHTNIIVVDDLTDGKKFKNLVDCQIADYQDYQQFLTEIQKNQLLQSIEVIFHQGACSDTTEWDGRYMLQNNYEYSKQLLHYCIARHVPLYYASSAAVYGIGTEFAEVGGNEQPLNVYGYSKWLFDQYVRRLMPTLTAPVVGLRYFNVYGPHETHKKHMASVAWHLLQQLNAGSKVKLFSGSGGYKDGEQQRDFVYVEDIVKINLWCWQNPQVTGIFNAGTGTNRSFNAVAHALIAAHGQGEIEYIPFPAHLVGVYQDFTKADLRALRQAGYTAAFTPLEEGLNKYYQWFVKQMAR